MEFTKLMEIMNTLFGENGCPWDREQTHESMRKHLLEECNEVIEAIDKKDMVLLREELGDLLLQVIFHAKIAEKAGLFNIDDVIYGLSSKLVSRHSHVFGDDKAQNAEEVVRIWEANKAKEKKC